MTMVDFNKTENAAAEEVKKIEVDKLFFNIGEDMFRVINTRLNNVKKSQMFYLFVVNHTFQFLETYKGNTGPELSGEEYQELLSNITNLAQSVYSCFSSIYYGERDVADKEQCGNLIDEKQLYSEFDSISPSEVFAFIDYCRYWHATMKDTHGFKLRDVRIILNNELRYIAIYAPVMQNNDVWWKKVTHHGSIEDKSSFEIAVALISSISVKASLCERKDIVEIIRLSMLCLIDGVRGSLESFIEIYCGSNGSRNFAIYDTVQFQVDNEPYEAVVRFIAFQGRQEICFQISIGTIGAQVTLHKPSDKWIKLQKSH